MRRLIQTEQSEPVSVPKFFGVLAVIIVTGIAIDKLAVSSKGAPARIYSVSESRPRR